MLDFRPSAGNAETTASLKQATISIPYGLFPVRTLRALRKWVFADVVLESDVGAAVRIRHVLVKGTRRIL
jgi:hypothetical protein